LDIEGFSATQRILGMVENHGLVKLFSSTPMLMRLCTLNRLLGASRSETKGNRSARKAGTRDEAMVTVMTSKKIKNVSRLAEFKVIQEWVHKPLIRRVYP
jgi:hypothetical protein